MAQTASRRRRFLLIAVALSVAVHLGAALLILLLPRILPHDTEPKDPATVELLMVEKKGDQPSDPGQPTDTKPAPQQQQQAETPKPEAPKAETPKPEMPKPEAPKAETPKPETPKPEAPKPETPKPEAPKAELQKDEPPAPQAAVAPPMPRNGDEPVPAPTEQSPPNPAEPNPAKPDPEKPNPAEPNPAKPNPAKEDPQPPPKQVESQPTPPPAPQAPVFDLAGTESNSNAIAMGSHILPAAPDDRFRNRPPDYPIIVQRRGEHGSVIVMIHVAENGTASSVDILESSGVDLLDQAAVAAVRKWRFHPAMKEGQAVPFDFPFEFIFEPR
jgi:periplasmic protein TonB